MIWKKSLFSVCFLLLCFLFVGCHSESEPLRIYIDLDNGSLDDGEEAVYKMERFLEHVADLGGPEDVVIESVPRWGTERKTMLSRIRTEIMAGEGPDIFITTGPVDGDETLFIIPEKAMENGLFLPLDDFIENAQFMEWDKLLPQIMEAGRDKYGQQILPISYTMPMTFFASEDVAEVPAADTTWVDMYNDETGILSTAGTWFHADSIAFEQYQGHYLEYTFGSIADYSEEELCFTEEELYTRILETFELRERYASALCEIAPAHYQTPLRVNFDYSAGDITWADNKDPKNGITENTAQTMIPIYSDEGGCSAEIVHFAAINANTKRPEDAFFVLDVLFSLESQQYSDIYEVFTWQALPTYTELAQENCPTRLDGRWFLNEANFQELKRIQDQITAVRFCNTLETELDTLFTDCETAYKNGDTEMIRQKVSETYRTMQRMLRE